MKNWREMLFNEENEVAPVNAETVREMVDEIERLRSALQIVADWNLPASGQFWDYGKTDPMSYEACFGTHGVRDYMKGVAKGALRE
ncbi:MAG: hypothetical protein ACXWT0_01880 [Methylobacter sp.]